MTLDWMSEACDLPAEPATGTFITRLTSAVMSNINIYCEQPYTSPDGRRIAILRSPYADPRMPPSELCVIDLQTLRLALVEREVQSIFVATAGYSGLLHYLDGQRRLVRFNLATLERDILFPWTLPAKMVLDTSTPDGRYLIGALPEPDFHTALVRVDLRDGSIETLYRCPEILCHVQANPVHGRTLLVQHNRGQSRNHEWIPRKTETPFKGATHFILDLETGTPRPLAIGEPFTSGTTGHSSWLAGTDRIGVSVSYGWKDVRTPGALDARFPGGNFFTVGPDDPAPRGFPAPDHRFNHVNVSRDGRYFVCDCYCRGLPGRIELVVGNIATGKSAVLLADCGAQGGGAACSHPHPYLTADNRRVIFNADRYSVCHVHAAHVTPDFLASLD